MLRLQFNQTHRKHARSIEADTRRADVRAGCIMKRVEHHLYMKIQSPGVRRLLACLFIDEGPGLKTRLQTNGSRKSWKGKEPWATKDMLDFVFLPYFSSGGGDDEIKLSSAARLGGDWKAQQNAKTGVTETPSSIRRRPWFASVVSRNNNEQ